MMGMRLPETCWAVFKRQAINLRDWCIWLVDLFEYMMTHGLAKYDDARTCKVWWCTDLQSMMIHGLAKYDDARTCKVWWCTDLQSMMMHGLAKYDDARTCKVWWCTDLQSMMMHGLTNPKFSRCLQFCLFNSALGRCLHFTYLLTPWSRVLLEKLTSKICS